MVHRNAGVDPRFRVVDAPLAARSVICPAAVVGRVLTQGASFRARLRHQPRWFTAQRGRGDGGLASLFEVREPPLGCDAR